MFENQASPQRIDHALEMQRSNIGSHHSESGTNFADLLAAESNAVVIGGRRMSGIRRTRYSHVEHFKAWEKVVRFIVNVIKISVLLILYIVVKNLEVAHKVDKIRQKWTSDVLLFYNYFLFTMTCLVLAMRVTKPQALFVFESFIFGILVLIFTFYSVKFFLKGFNMYEDPPKDELQKEPESYFLYGVYLTCFIVNAILLAGVIYVLCYIAVMTF